MANLMTDTKHLMRLMHSQMSIIYAPCLSFFTTGLESEMDCAICQISI